MISQRFAIGTEIATQLPLPSENFADPGTPPKTLKELLDIIAARGDKNFAMLRTTTVRLSEFMDKPTAELSIDELVDVRSGFSDYLKQRHYKANSIRTYRQNTQRLVKWAEQLGWVSGKQSVEELLEAFSGRTRGQSSGVHLHHLSCDPEPAASIGVLCQRSGRLGRIDAAGWPSIQNSPVRKWNFRRAITNAGLNSLLPKLEPAPPKSAYRVRADELS